MQPTSLEALKSIDRMSIAEKILCELRILPSTDDELEQRLNMRHQTVSSCRRLCVKKGWVVVTGNKRPTRSGRNANVWELTKEGKAQVEIILERKGK
jgi:predicted transcriptional regulator